MPFILLMKRREKTVKQKENICDIKRKDKKNTLKALNLIFQ